MLVFDLRQAFLALDVIADQVHRAGPIERDQRDDVVELLHVDLLRDAGHAAGFQLENADRFAAVEERKGRRVVERDVLERKFRLALADRASTVSSMTVSVFSPRKSIFSRPRSFSGPIAYCVTTSLPFESRQSGTYSERSRSPMTTPAAWTPALRVRPSSKSAYSQSWRVAGSVSIAFFRSGVFSAAAAERDVQLVRDHLRDPVAVAVAQAHHAADVAHHAFRLQRAEGDDLRDAALAVFLPHVFDDFAAARFAKIDVDIGRRDALGIEEALEEQAELERIDVGDPQHIGDQRTGRRTAPRADWDAALLREVDEVPDDEEVADEAGLLEDARVPCSSGHEALRPPSLARRNACANPSAQSSRRYWLRVLPAGASYSGYFEVPNSSLRSQRSAIASVFEIASGCSGKSARISSALLK